MLFFLNHILLSLPGVPISNAQGYFRETAKIQTEKVKLIKAYCKKIKPGSEKMLLYSVIYLISFIALTFRYCFILKCPYMKISIN